jgi:hypothetical protein
MRAGQPMTSRLGIMKNYILANTTDFFCKRLKMNYVSKLKIFFNRLDPKIVKSNNDLHVLRMWRLYFVVNEA